MRNEKQFLFIFELLFIVNGRTIRFDDQFSDYYYCCSILFCFSIVSKHVRGWKRLLTFSAVRSRSSCYLHVVIKCCRIRCQAFHEFPSLRILFYVRHVSRAFAERQFGLGWLNKRNLLGKKNSSNYLYWIFSIASGCAKTFSASISFGMIP